jgi:hypothetical protein
VREHVLLTPSRLGGTSVRNRLVLAPMTRTSATADGSATERMRRYYTRFARGGFAALITEGVFIEERRSPGYPNQPGSTSPAHGTSRRTITDDDGAWLTLGRSDRRTIRPGSGFSESVLAGARIGDVADLQGAASAYRSHLRRSSNTGRRYSFPRDLEWFTVWMESRDPAS